MYGKTLDTAACTWIALPYHEKHAITLVSSIDQFTNGARSRILEQNEIVREKKRHPRMPFDFLQMTQSRAS
ncbi:MAG: hypothetical protein H7315_13955 [Herminiimonas sp.]|nr:hypothetical protein [Herminiimonas sp.]